MIISYSKHACETNNDGKLVSPSSKDKSKRNGNWNSNFELVLENCLREWRSILFGFKSGLLIMLKVIASGTLPTNNFDF